jgi:hypothetical protein
MQHRKYFLSLSLLLLLISGCSTVKQPDPIVVTKTQYIKQEVPIQPRPDAIKLNSVYFHVVTEDNLQDFINKFKEKEGELVFFALSVPDYENMSLNIAELKRYIEQQKSLIIYYEEGVSIELPDADDQPE